MVRIVWQPCKQTVNFLQDYQVGQGISKHTDSNDFGPEIFCVSLMSDCVMTFRKENEKMGMLLHSH